MDWLNYLYHKNPDLAKKEILQVKSEEKFLEQSYNLLANAVKNTSNAVDDLISGDNDPLFKTKRRINAMGHLIHDVIAVTSKDGTIDTISNKCNAMFGHDEEYYIGENISELFAISVREQHFGYFNGDMPYDHDTNPTIETIMCRGDHSEFYAEFTIEKFEEDDECMFMIIIRDITSRKDDEGKLQEAKRNENFHRMLATCLDHIDDMVILVNAEKNAVYVNKAFTDHYGFCLDDIVGKRPRDVIGELPINPELYENIYSDYLDNGLIWTGQLPNKTKNGNGVIDDIKIIPIMGDDNKPQFYLSIHKLVVDNSV